ncbi:SAM-dependent methyltransferase [Lichenibacterium ramalinae]|uniref:Class I SAM-dependent methyltransferase n=1 Tax=Lichenibacterium ramalinae TaxID=2316527 RepID=A0A4Q2RG23_9HYPH|nr:cyclopropane-fatty-acyl-phospholipid synthase family protein [Lichenibacterium ramalinae]RYB07136.1 class I SAM-dependent methyltransferase [Lichenibacterium ramalinae]
MLKTLLARLIRHGRLTVTTPFGTVAAGQRDESLPAGRLDVRLRLRKAATVLKLATNPDLYFGEAYMDGDLVIEQGSLYDLMELLGSNIAALGQDPNPKVGQWASKVVGALSARNDPRKARANVAHHYDLSGELYRSFLDSDMQYSCAYFRHPDDDIEAAQLAKRQHIAAKLLLAPGQHVLDIGCGWGGLALFIARTADVRVTGITLSQEQLAVARRRAKEEGLDHRVKFELVDYRLLQGQFDRIVSIGMFEHVGLPNYETYFGAIKRLLAPAGIAMVHSIGKMYGPAPTSTWILKYIFPGGYVPALSEVLPAVERQGLWLNDLEVLRLHYADTLRLWRERFEARWADLSRVYDERFRRMWEFYLVGSEISFRHFGFMVFQVQLARAVDAAPPTRDYLYEAEVDMRARAAAAPGTALAAE